VSLVTFMSVDRQRNLRSSEVASGRGPRSRTNLWFIFVVHPEGTER
jgi:hypothetical protein